MVNNAQFPLNSYQRDVWAADSVLPDSPQFNGAIHEQLAGPVDLEVLRACLERAVRGNDAFGLRFGERDGQPYQWQTDEPAVVDLLDFRAEADPAQACARWMDQAFASAFQANGGRLYQVALLRESDETNHLYLRTHHVMMDGWALNEFSRQVFADYAHIVDHGTPANSPRQSYLEFLDEDQRYRSSATHERDRAFFQRELADLEPTLFARSVPTGERRFGRTTFLLDGGLVDRMLAAGASPFAYIAAVFATYLTRVHRSTDVVLGVPMLNRPSDALRGTLGQFANTLPLRVRTDGRSMTDLATAVRASSKALQEHEKLALGDVLRALPSTGAQARRLFDVTVSYVRFPRPTAIPGVERDTVIMSRGHDQDTLSVVVRAFEDVSEVAVDLEYALDVFDEDFPAEAVGGHIR